MAEENTGGCPDVLGGGRPCACGTAETAPDGGIRETTSRIAFADRIDHFLARWGVNRRGHTVIPGLYRLGHPGTGSAVFASANYTLSFDALRSTLAGIDCYILVLDTRGVNVWCAAGKGTFGSDELVRQIRRTALGQVVSHRTIIVPQLGAPGISWPAVLRESGFQVEYGPVRADDLPEYLRTHTATTQMRRVEFPLMDRLILAPVEVVSVALPAVVAAIVLLLLAGPVSAVAAIAAVFAGTVLFPALLPYLPVKDFSAKGLILGVPVAIPFAGYYATLPAVPGWANVLGAAVPLLIMPAVTAFLALSFTGASTCTSRTGVKKEIYRYIRLLAGMAALGTIAGAALGVAYLMGVR